MTKGNENKKSQLKMNPGSRTMETTIAKEELESCLSCGKKLKPALDCKNYITGKWDGHSYLPCYVCSPNMPRNVRIIIG